MTKKRPTHPGPPSPEPVRDETGRFESHPSYGCVTLSRVQGSVHLVGSQVAHQSFILLSIHDADLTLGDESRGVRMFPRKQIVEVALSEAQFATLITTWNVHGGTPCTLVRRPPATATLESVPHAPTPKRLQEDMDAMVHAAAQRLTESVKDGIDEVRRLVAGKLGKKAQDELERTLRDMQQNITPNVDFTAERLHEYAEHTVASVKVELEAAGASVVQRMGLAALQNGAAPTAHLLGAHVGDSASEEEDAA